MRGVDDGGKCGRDIILLELLERWVVDRWRRDISGVLSGIHANKRPCEGVAEATRWRDVVAPRSRGYRREGECREDKADGLSIAWVVPVVLNF